MKKMLTKLYKLPQISVRFYDGLVLYLGSSFYHWLSASSYLKTAYSFYWTVKKCAVTKIFLMEKSTYSSNSSKNSDTKKIVTMKPCDLHLRILAMFCKTLVTVCLVWHLCDLIFVLILVFDFFKKEFEKNWKLLAKYFETLNKYLN